MPLIKKKDIAAVDQEDRKNTRECAALIDSLTDSSATTRRWAARDLVNCPNAAIVLVDHLKCEPELSVREVILSTLTQLGDAAAVAGLVDCLRSEDAALRNEAVEAMKQLPDEVAPMMQGLLTDSDPDVRIFTVNILESLCHPDVEAWLIEVISTDPHINVCATAVDLLSEVGTQAALAPLALLKSRFLADPYIQFAANLALRRIRPD
jgi:HEAT repeat protein